MNTVCLVTVSCHDDERERERDVMMTRKSYIFSCNLFDNKSVYVCLFHPMFVSCRSEHC